MSNQHDVLMARVLANRRKGLELPRKPGRNLERYYDTLQVLAMAQRFHEQEIRALGRATDPRERGLKAARDGDLRMAAALVAEARAIYEAATLSTAAASCAETFQAAAEAYIQYRSGAFAAAARSMTRSLEICEVLAAEFGFPLELRRVHLARTIARVRASDGDEAEALRISLGLLRYLGRDEGAWPLPCAGPPRRHLLEDDAALLMLDQVLTEGARLLDPGKPAASDMLPAVRRAGAALIAVEGSAPFQRAARCLGACALHVQGDLPGFLGEASLFFEGGPQYLEFAWGEMEKKLPPSGILT